jgi:hypothetical protein
MTRIGASDRRSFTAENDSGGRPATPASRDQSATHTDDEIVIAPFEDLLAAAALDIERGFRARLNGARCLPRQQRALARRLAREWRRDALRALADRRLIDQRARAAYRRALRLQRFRRDLH